MPRPEAWQAELGFGLMLAIFEEYFAPSTIDKIAEARPLREKNQKIKKPDLTHEADQCNIPKVHLRVSWRDSCATACRKVLSQSRDLQSMRQRLGQGYSALWQLKLISGIINSFLECAVSFSHVYP